MNSATIKNCQRLYGCDFEQALAANDSLHFRAAGSFARAYNQQRANAGYRGIGWEITFPQWVALWSASGHWSKRGRAAGCYCMARHGDIGPYAIDNVSIQPVEVNCGDAFKRAQERGANWAEFAKRRRGTGRGWTLIQHKKTNPYQVCIGDKYVGSFATQEEAEAAYAAAI